MTRGLSYLHRGGDEPLLGCTIPLHFAEVAQRFAEREALVGLPQGRRLSYSELKLAVDELARALLATGLGRGDHVGIWSTNNVEWLLLQLATARIGAILVTVNPGYRSGELLHALERSEVKVLFSIPSFRTSDYVGRLLEVASELGRSGPPLRCQNLPQLERVVIFDPARPRATERPAPGFTTWQELLSGASAISEAQLEEATRLLDADDPINVQYTSGTTGRPKAVVLSHHNILNNAYFAARAMRLDERDRLCVSVPFYHCFGMVLANLCCLSVGACVVVPCEHFDAGRVIDAIESERCTAVHGVPTMFVAALEHPRLAQRDFSSLRTGIMAGAPCPPALMERVITRMRCEQLLIGYGETEASPLTHLTAPDDTFEQRTQTVGRNLPHQELKIVDVATGRVVPVGEPGEICFRGYHLMRGYHRDPEATRRAIDEAGWLHSGDLGSLDASGYLRITGRLKEMIIVGGENVYPREIEDCLFGHPEVEEAAVFGVPDDYWGEKVMAWVKLRPGATLREGDLVAHCRERLAHFKVPRHLWLVDAFPMTVTGKLQKFRMREMALDRLKSESAGAAAAPVPETG